MAAQKKSITLTSSLRPIQARVSNPTTKFGLSTVIDRDLCRYYNLLARCRRVMRGQFLPEELDLIYGAVTDFAEKGGTLAPEMLPGVIQNYSTYSSNIEMRPESAAYLKDLPVIYLLALIDASEKLKQFRELVEDAPIDDLLADD